MLYRMRSVLMMAVWSYGCAAVERKIVPLGIHGDTTTAGTRTPSRSNAKSCPGCGGLGGTTAGGGTWSKQPPCSSKVITSRV